MNLLPPQNSLGEFLSYSFAFFILSITIYLLRQYIMKKSKITAFALAQVQQLNENLEQRVKERTQELQASEARQRAIFDAEPDAMLISDPQGIIVMANQQVERLLGYSSTELVGQSIELLIPDSFREQHIQHREKYNAAPYSRLMGSGLGGVVAVRKDGSLVDVEISLSPIQTEQGQLFATALRDITQRKHAEAILKASEARFRLIANSSPIMIWITDEMGEPVFANLAWLKFVGLESAYEMTHAEWRKAVHPDDIATAFSAYYINVDAHEPIATEYRLRHADGKWRWVFDQGVPMFDELGMFIGYIGSLIDITDRKNTESELRIAATAFESHEAMVITDADSVILRVNAAFTETTGYTSEEVIGQKMNLLRSGHHEPAFYETMWASIKRDGAWQGEIWDRRKNGEVYPKWLTITAVADEKGIVTHYVGTQSDITERKAAENKIQRLAYYDPLTQLPNRRLLQDRIEHGISSAQREHKQLAVLMIDLDRFKAVNDSLGHLAGDELLQKVAIRLSSRLRGIDSIARLGGDEFIVLLENIVHPEDAARMAELLVADLSRPFLISQSDDVRIGASIGISLYPQQGDNPTQLMEQADAALYQAKAKGRGCFAYFSDELTRIARERMVLEMRLRVAIEEQQLRVFYQAQTDIRTGRIIGAEALVRWQDPIDGLISPDKFIGIAEESGLINALGEWVLRETCRQGREWLDAGLPAIILAVNVSPQQFKRSSIPELVAKVLSETAFPATQLELEITENGLMDQCTFDTEEDKVVHILDELRALGVHLAIDDFGTGYSSLAYLKRFPLNILKIDKSFIDDIPNNKNGMEIAATIIAMAHILDFKVLAEGVETAEQLAFLQQKGCDYYQGYFKSRPLPAHEFVELLCQQNL